MGPHRPSRDPLRGGMARSSSHGFPTRRKRALPMAPLIFCVVWPLSLLFAAGRTAEGQTPLRVGAYENAPKISCPESGKASGIFVDILEHIARAEGWSVQYVCGTWPDALDRLERGEIDLMPDVAYTAQRGERYSFHEVPVLSSWFQVYAPKGSGIRSILDLDGKRVAVLSRSVQQEAFEQLADGFGLRVSLIPLPDYREILEMVRRKEADAAITNRFHGALHARKYGLEDTAVIFHPTQLFFAAPKSAHKDFLHAIDRHLSSLKADPGSIYYQSLRRWVSDEVPFALPPWVSTVGLVMSALLAAALAAGVVLKRQVDVRTRELRSMNQEMEQRIRQRTAELSAAMERAQAADRVKSAFLATMSHELRTPLNSIIGFTGILLQGLAGPLNDEQRKQLSMVQASSRHLLALINDVLDISKIEAGELTLSVTSFDLRPSIEKVVRMVAPLADKKGLSITLDLADGVGTVLADERRLEQVVLNLLNNAVKFTEKGGLRVACRGEADDWVISVADTGIGIDPQAIEEIFRPFHQLDKGTTRSYEGTGLGLSISRRLVEMMGGSIEVQSHPGKGSTFTVRLPKGRRGGL